MDLEKNFSEDGQGLDNQPSSISDDLWDFSSLPPVDPEEISRLLNSLDFSSLPLDFDANFSRNSQGLDGHPSSNEASSLAIPWDFSTLPLDFDLNFSEGGQGLHTTPLMDSSSSLNPSDFSSLPLDFDVNFLKGGQGLRNPLLMETSSSVNPSDLSSLPLDLEVDFSDGGQALPDASQEQSDSAEEEDADSDSETDAILTAFELKLILEERELYRQERAALLQRLQDTDAQIKKLKKDYAQINNKSRRSPILQLPVEMIRLIFAYTQGPAYSRGQSVSFFEQPEPLAEVLVSHVCRIWRLVALDYAELWTRFRFDASQAQCVPLERFEAYMQRSKLLPVELYLNFEDFDEDEQEDEHEDDYAEEQLVLLEMTMKYTERWQVFFVTTDEDSLPILATLETLAEASVPNLEYFGYLNRNNCIDWEEDLGKTIFMKGAPKLKSITFDLSLGERLVPPLQNITTLCLEDHTWECRSIQEPLTWQTFAEMLSLPCLTNLSLLGWVVEEPLAFPEPFEMNRLENLRFGRADYFLMFLPFLKAPVLKTLTIALLKYDLGEDPPEPTSFPSLESLCLVNIRSTATAWRDIAKLTKSIKHLTLVNENYDEACFAFLRSGEAFWTNLKSITMDIGGLGDREVELEAFLIVRRNPSLQLSIRRHVLQQWESKTSSKGEASARWDLLCRLKPTPDDFGIEPAVWQDHLSWINLQPDDNDEVSGSESE